MGISFAVWVTAGAWGAREELGSKGEDPEDLLEVCVALKGLREALKEHKEPVRNNRNAYNDRDVRTNRAHTRRGFLFSASKQRTSPAKRH